MSNYTIDIGQGKDLSQQVMSKFSLSLLAMMVGMIVGAMFIPPAVAVMMPFVCLIMLLVAVFVRARQRSAEGGAIFSMKFVYAFAAIEGVGLYPIIMVYTQVLGAQLVLGAVAISFVLFFGLAVYAKRTTRNFIGLAPMLFGGLLVLLLASIIGIFVHATILQTAICAGGVFIFSGYVLVDIQMMKSGYLTEDDVPMMVLNLFLDWINLFLYILQLIGLVSDN